MDAHSFSMHILSNTRACSPTVSGFDGSAVSFVSGVPSCPAPIPALADTLSPPSRTDEETRGVLKVFLEVVGAAQTCSLPHVAQLMSPMLLYTESHSRCGDVLRTRSSQGMHSVSLLPIFPNASQPYIPFTSIAFLYPLSRTDHHESRRCLRETLDLSRIYSNPLPNHLSCHGPCHRQASHPTCSLLAGVAQAREDPIWCAVGTCAPV